MCLVTILLGGYVYLSSLTLEQQNYLTNAAFVVVGGVAFVTLLLIGDLSKDRPNFYYI
ncbi:uncharacterized protein Dwil_GK26949 [Drosophila willistoni]|uniref:Uncharacterized protein n=2 Tax=Drosophila willistoni TaxID=7260 RepID=A0A0Q9X2J5_DROWI|nr:uncharacterized protein Dwil_GK26949 [Drosophila willistoni]